MENTNKDRGEFMFFGWGFNNKKFDIPFALAIIVTFVLLFIFSGVVHGQTSTVSATITDINGQAYNNGSYNIQYVPPTGTGSANPPIRKDTGVAITQRYSGSLDGTGAFSVAGITRTDYINPAQGQWRFTICPLATSSCFTYTTPNGITTGTLDLTASLSAASVPVAVTASTSLFSLIPRAYQDAEVSGNVEGSQYYNINTKLLKWYDGSAWNYNIASNTVASLKKLNGIAFAGIYAGADIGAQINAAVTDIGCGVVFISSASYNSATKIVTPRCVDVVGAGPQAAIINYTGAGVNWVIGDTAIGFTTANYGIENISLIGPGTGSSTIGLYLGGDPASTISPSTYFANSVSLNKVQIEAFNTCVQWGNNAYLNSFFASTIKGCSTGNYFPAGISNSGENINYIATTVSNHVGATGSAFRLDSANTDIHFSNSSLDYNASPAIKGTNPSMEFAQAHLEESVGEFINAAIGTFKFTGGEIISTCSAACGADPQFITLSGAGGTQLIMQGTTFVAGHPMTQAINWTASGTYAQINLKSIPCYNGNGNLPLLTNTFTIGRGTYIEDCEANGGNGLITIGMPIKQLGGQQIQTTAGAAMLDLFDITGAAPTPHKFFRVTNGRLEFLNSAFSQAIMSLSDIGVLSLGAVPALTGNLNLPNNGFINFRNHLNTGDVAAIGVNGSDKIVIDFAGNGTTTGGNLAPTSFTLGTGTALSFDKIVTDSPGAITVNAQTCTDRGVAIAGLLTTATISAAANYALEANLFTSPGQTVAGTAHYRICNPTAANITLAAGSTFNIEVRQ